MSLGDVYRLSIESRGGDQTFVNVLHYRQDSANLVDSGGKFLLDSVDYDLLPVYYLTMSGDVYVSRIVAAQVVGGAEVAERPETVFGGAAGTTYAFQACPLISWSTGLAGRANRGRTYLPPVTESMVTTAGQIETVNIPDFEGLADKLMSIGTLLQPGAFTLGLWSLVTPSFRPITGYRIRKVLATQRRRRFTA